MHSQRFAKKIQLTFFCRYYGDMKRSWLFEALGNDTMAINRTDLSYTGRTINNVVFQWHALHYFADILNVLEKQKRLISIFPEVS